MRVGACDGGGFQKMTPRSDVELAPLPSPRQREHRGIGKMSVAEFIGGVVLPDDPSGEMIPI
eukprot:9497112-Pyramimonas_sp.AAC.1